MSAYKYSNSQVSGEEYMITLAIIARLGVSLLVDNRLVGA